MELNLSFIIPVYNRPEEVNELLQSFVEQNTNYDFEIVIVEDGSNLTSKDVVDSFSKKLDIGYYFKENSGPGDSRNFGMVKAKGNYFIILDSDCILPSNYIETAIKNLKSNYADCFGGPDSAHESFTDLQKAINFSMTSFITTGGIRGGKNSVEDFQPRSFNMGISKKAFGESKGFGKIHPGEDPDLSIRLSKLGYKTVLYPDLIVFHKRRISWKKFYQQVNKFGSVRPILNQWHPETKKITYWFPTFFISGFIVAVFLWAFGYKWFVLAYAFYFFLVLATSLFKNKSFKIALMSLLAVAIQFFGYGYGFLISTFYVNWLNKEPEKVFPKLFFK